MAFVIDETTISPNFEVIYNNVKLDKIVCDGTTVWERYYYIFQNGATASSIFEGVKVTGFDLNRAGWEGAGNVSNSGNNMVVQGNINNYSSVFSKQKINLSAYKTAKIVVSSVITGSNGGTVRVGFTNSQSNKYNGTYKDVGTGTITLDISGLTGDYYMAFAFVGETKVTISQIYLEA